MSIIIKNGTVITMEDDKIVNEGAIYVEDERIVEVGKTDYVTKKYRAEHIIDAKRGIILPGFANAHDHSDVKFVRGIELDAEIMDYLKRVKWPRVRAMREDDFHTAALLSYIDNLKSGVTLVCDNVYSTKKTRLDGVPRAAKEAGIRCAFARGYHDLEEFMPPDFVESEAEFIREYTRLFQSWHNKENGRVKIFPSPVNIVYNKVESLRKLGELARKYDSGIHSHVAEDKKGTAIIRRKYGKGYVELLREQGILTDKFQAAHAIYLSKKEHQILAKAGGTAVHNPVSNMNRAAGIAPILQMLKNRVRVALGTDSQLDMFTAMRCCIWLQKVSTMNPMPLTARDALRFATVNGVAAFGLGRELGTLKRGKKADIVVMNKERPHSITIEDPIKAVVYYLNPSDVQTVIVDGRIVVLNREIQTINERKLLEVAKKNSMRIYDKLR